MFWILYYLWRCCLRISVEQNEVFSYCEIRCNFLSFYNPPFPSPLSTLKTRKTVKLWIINKKKTIIKLTYYYTIKFEMKNFLLLSKGFRLNLALIDPFFRFVKLIVFSGRLLQFFFFLCFPKQEFTEACNNILNIIITL